MTWRTLTRAALTLGVSAGACSGILAGTAVAAPGDLNVAMVKDVYPGGGSGAFNLVAVNDTLFFVGSTPANGDELWRSDGTAAGTAMVKAINGTPSADESCDCEHLTNVGGTVFFSATDGSHGKELWMSDGTPGGTAMVKDINSTPSSSEDSSPDQLTNVGGTLFFTADDGVNGRELWKSDGTSSGTTMVQDINTASGVGSDPGELEGVGGTLFLSADDGNGAELWKSDGPAYSSASMV